MVFLETTDLLDHQVLLEREAHQAALDQEVSKGCLVRQEKMDPLEGMVHQDCKVPPA